jgi:outer membrane receptor protein involved in Fe transport
VPAATSGQLREICLAQGVPVARLGDPTLGSPSSSTPQTTFGGNPNLGEEKGRTWTAGAIFTPRFLPGFSATADYYDIKVEGFISSVGIQNIGTACFTLFLPQYCSRITRDAAGDVERITDVFENTGALKTRGLDVTAAYTHRFGSALGAENVSLSVNFAGTQVFNFDFIPILGLPTINKCAGKFGLICGGNVPGRPLPKWRHTLRTTLGLGAVQASASGATSARSWTTFPPSLSLPNG